MLVEFSVTNYKSIKQEARFSLVANRGTEHREKNVVVPTMQPGVRSDPLLRAAAIYGANAAGKTNVLKAMDAMRTMVRRSARGLDELPVEPFRFDSETAREPTTLEATLIAEGVRYQYGFSANRTAILREWLFAWPRGRVQTWFERGPELEGGYRFGDRLSGDREVWRRATRTDALFLSTAIGLNSQQLQPVSRWFTHQLRVASVDGWSSSFSLQCCEDDRKDGVVNFLREADLAIADVRIVDEEIANAPADDVTATKVRKLRLLHDVPDGSAAELDLREESQGTQAIFALAGPWLDTLNNGYVIAFDELHGNLHPSLVRFLVSQFQDPRVNTNGAQLVFTTHETAILSQDEFRRDQIWFCDRNERQETSLFPLSDFRPRKDVENLERAYLAGRYGAVPFIRSSLPTPGQE